MPDITPELIDRAKDLHAQGLGWRVVAAQLGVSHYALRGTIDPAWLARIRAQNRKPMVLNRRPRKPASHAVKAMERMASPDQWAERERRLEALALRTEAEKLMGDPPAAFSALAQRATRAR